MKSSEKSAKISRVPQHDRRAGYECGDPSPESSSRLRSHHGREWYGGRFVWALSTDILMEYREVIVRQSGASRWNALEKLMNLTAGYRGNLLHVSPSFYFRTITADQDDDKFADCAITAHSDWIVTEDTHFKALIGSGFKPQPIKPRDFITGVLRSSP